MANNIITTAFRAIRFCDVVSWESPKIVRKNDRAGIQTTNIVKAVIAEITESIRAFTTTSVTGI